FRWGRKYHHDPEAVEQFAQGPAATTAPATLDELVDRRARDLTAYQSAPYAARYRDWIERVRRREQEVRPGSTELAEAAARYLYKLMAYKDEYEVARLVSKS